MKKTLLIALMLAFALGASTLAAQNTNWQGTYVGDPTGPANYSGTWAGTVYYDPMGPAAPHFEGKWASDDGSDYGTLYASLVTDGAGTFKVVKGVAYDNKGNEVGTWDGYFQVNSPAIIGAEGNWYKIDGSAEGTWKGWQVP